MYVKQKQKQYVWHLDSHCSKCFARLVVWDSRIHMPLKCSFETVFV